MKVQNNEELKEKEPRVPPPPGIGKRHIQTLLLFLSLFTNLMIRANLSIALVAMTNPHLQQEEELNTVYNNTQLQRLNSDISSTIFQTYNWSKSIQDTIGGSFFVGYFLMNIPMGIMSQKLGGKVTITVSLLVNSVISIILPWTPIWGDWWAICFCRFVQGLTQAAMYPSVHTVLGHWVPLWERGRLSSFAYAGVNLGTVAAFQSAGFICGSPSLGWPFVFWFTGAFGLISFFLMLFLGASTPAEHSSISEQEKLFILDGVKEDDHTYKRKTPWIKIFRTVPFWVNVIAHGGSAFAFLTCLIELPIYMNRVLNVEIKKNGFLSSLPSISMCIFNIIFGQLCDFFVNKKIITLKTARRFGNTLGLPVAGILLVAFSYAKTVPLAVSLMILAFGFHSGAHIGFVLTYIDLAPNYAGIMMSIGNTAASLMGVCAPTLVALVVNDADDQSQWQTIFIIVAVVMLLTNIPYVIYVKTDVQPWNEITVSSHNGVQDCEYEKVNTVIFATNDTDESLKDKMQIEDKLL